MIALKSLARFIVSLHRIRFTLWSSIALAVALAMAPNSSAQSIVFGEGTTYPAGDGPWGLVAGDFNGDGRPDLAVANHGFAGSPNTLGNGVSVLLCNTNGTFQSAVAYPGGVGPTHLVSADLNRDGKLDLVTANSESNSFSVLFGNGDGTFQAAVNYSVSERPASVIAADFNRDGYPDLVLSIRGTILSVFLADGNGGFKPAVDYPVAPGPQDLTSGDFNGDGKLDILTSCIQSKSLSVLLKRGRNFRTAINSGTGDDSTERAGRWRF
jgi:hypothetical protein